MLLPRIWGMGERAPDAGVAAASGTLVVAAFPLMLTMERLTGLTRRMRG